MTAQKNATLPSPIIVPFKHAELDSALTKEWLLTNKLGSYASSTIVGCNTRRYHGLLVAATKPPAGRIVALSMILEQVQVGQTIYDLATNEFTGAFSPRGINHLVEFANDVAPRMIYHFGDCQITKEIILAESVNAVAIRYTYRGPAAAIRLWPFVAMRNYHELRKVHQPHQMMFENSACGTSICDRMRPAHSLHVQLDGAKFEPKPQWWYRFLYRVDVARGQDGFEDLYTPGHFDCPLSDGSTIQFTASLNEPLTVDFKSTVESRRSRLESLAGAVGEAADETMRRLAVATDTFITQRGKNSSPPTPTILAGFHWFADWGRDAFVALPGLLLCTGRFEQARGVFKTFVDHLSEGMIPNNFDETTGAAHYNSIDASLWFIVAADRYVAATNDVTFWRDTLMPACHAILTAYRNGTRFYIHADADGLLAGGSSQTQLTWMDAKLGEEAITPRHGKAVEVNALWHCAHRIMAERCVKLNGELARHYAQLAELIAPAFVKTFWNERDCCLYDCITDGRPDATIRPNQIFAVSLPHSPLLPQQQSAVLHTVQQHLLTPFGLRTLSPADSRYRKVYGDSWESRDRAYHQGTVWAWLIAPMVEALLRVEPDKAAAARTAACWLAAFDEHLHQAGLGTVSEIFDGDTPHHPQGCIAQAWSVAEVLRAKLMVTKYLK